MHSAQVPDLVEPLEELREELRRLRRRGAILWATVAMVGMIAVARAAIGAARPPQAPAVADVLRARTIVLEDQAGRSRVILGAPVPATENRKAFCGMVLHDDSGKERLWLGAPVPDPPADQMREITGGQPGQRRVLCHGVVVLDGRGWERGGYATLDDGSVLLTMDGEKCERAVLALYPDGTCGLTFSDDAARQRACIGLMTNGRSFLNLSDAVLKSQVLMLVPAEGDPSVEVLDKERRSAFKTP